MIDQARRQRLKEKYKDEQVFVVPHIVFSGLADKFTRLKHTPDIWGRFDSIGKYIMRYDAEYQPSMQQIIPYIIVRHKDGQRYFVAKRLAGEERLINTYSLGFGGHINTEDGIKEVLFKALVREMFEELHIEPIGSAEFVGYIRDLTSETNDHTGCVFIVDSDETCCIKERDNLKGEWMTVDELEKNYFKFEGWARYIIDFLVGNGKKF